MAKVKLSHTTLVCVDCVNYGDAINAIQKSMEQCEFGRVVFLTDVPLEVEGVEVIAIPTITSKLDYSKFMINRLDEYVNTPFCLVIQYDGYVLDGNAWNDEFLKYDYIGAPWLYTDGRNVGNGGFSLRSKKLLTALATDPHISCHNNEDDVICREYRGHLEKRHYITFAPDALADEFAFELRQPNQPTFGFHGNFHKPYKPIIVIKRTAAMGDIVSIEPIASTLHEIGKQVYLDIPIQYMELFSNHPYGFQHFSKLDTNRIPYKLLNLDMAYEVFPNKNHVQAYFDMTFGLGAKVQIRNAKLFPKVSPQTKLFEKYVVLNIDTRETTHRNVFGVDWVSVVKAIRSKGYEVIQVGTTRQMTGAVRMNCPTIGMLKLVIAGADAFIGVDSGPAQIAVAHEIPSVIIFGSVNPRYIYPDITDDMEILENICPIGKQFCWHESSGTSGSICEADQYQPPCCVYDNNTVIRAFDKLITPKPTKTEQL